MAFVDVKHLAHGHERYKPPEKKGTRFYDFVITIAERQKQQNKNLHIIYHAICFHSLVFIRK